MKWNQIAVAVSAGLMAAGTVGLLPPPYDKWATVVVAVLAGATRGERAKEEDPEK